jgi:hypothetical protein
VIVLQDEEVLFLEAGDEAIHGIGDGKRDEDEVGVDAELYAGAERGAGGEGDGRVGLFGDGCRGCEVDRVQRIVRIVGCFLGVRLRQQEEEQGSEQERQLRKATTGVKPGPMGSRQCLTTTFAPTDGRHGFTSRVSILARLRGVLQ